MSSISGDAETFASEARVGREPPEGFCTAPTGLGCCWAACVLTGSFLVHPDCASSAKFSSVSSSLMSAAFCAAMLGGEGAAAGADASSFSLVGLFS